MNKSIIKHIEYLLLILALLALIIGWFPVPALAHPALASFTDSNRISATPAVNMSIYPAFNGTKSPGDNFWVNLNVISQVTDLNTYQFYIAYDPTVIQVNGAEGDRE